MEQEQKIESTSQKLTGELSVKNITAKQSDKEPWRIFPIAVGISMVALGFGVWYFHQREQVLDLSPSEVEQLSVDEKQTVLETQLRDLEAEASRLTPESDRGDRFTTYIQLAETYTALGRHEEALKALDNIKDERAGNTRVWMTYALVYQNMGDNNAARIHAYKALDLDAELTDNWLFMFSLLDDLSLEVQDAIYKEALQRSGNLPEIAAAYQAWQAAPQ
jgi:tetratricopeptide (TPR) repeat protein